MRVRAGAVGYLAGIARSLDAGDYSEEILDIARRHYGERISLRQFDAQDMPFEDKSKDVIILFEAIYYIPDAAKFVKECARVLRSEGKCSLLRRTRICLILIRVRIAISTTGR